MSEHGGAEIAKGHPGPDPDALTPPEDFEDEELSAEEFIRLLTLAAEGGDFPDAA